MAITGNWYKSLNSPKDATSAVGGAIDTGSTLAGVLSELFEQGHSKFLGRGDYVRYRKVFFRNEGGDAISDAVAFWNDLEHVDQLKFAVEKVSGDSSADSETMPSGYAEADFIAPLGLSEATGAAYIGTIPATTGEIGFWIRQTIPEGLNSDTGAYGGLVIAGNVP